MNAGKVKHKYEQLGQALQKLGEVVGDVHDDRDRDALIQRFEFTIELYWKYLKELLQAQGLSATLPKSAFSEAYAAGWLSGTKEIWYEMLKDRNLSSHTYNEKLAQEIAQRIEDYYPYLKQTYENLAKTVEDTNNG